MTQPNAPCSWCQGDRSPGELCACTPCPSCDDYRAIYFVTAGTPMVAACPCTRQGWTHVLGRKATPTEIDQAMEDMARRVRGE